jgi:glycosyltransferase involved in cell wall biosynthesis
LALQGSSELPNNSEAPSRVRESGRPDSLKRPIRVLAFMEALSSTTGPAKNFIEFASRATGTPQSSVRADVVVATFHRGSGAPSNNFVVACQESGLKVHVLHERFLFDLAVIPAIRKLVVCYQPDIIQSHAVKSHFLIRLSGAYRERLWIAFHHGYTWTNPRTRLYNQLDRWSLRAASKVVAVCGTFASTLESIGVCPERIVIQHNSVKTFSPASDNEVIELRRSLGISPDTQVLICVGRLSREKGQADLIQVASLLRKSNYPRKIKFILAGEGPDEQKLKAAARSFHVEDWFIFTGHIPDLRPYYTLADLLVLPSHTEGSPNVLLEAMAAGLPIIATAVGGVPEIVMNEKEALLVEKHNPVAIARAIERVLSDGGLRIGLTENAQQRSSAYSPAAYCDSLLTLYQNSLVKKVYLSDPQSLGGSD